MRIWREFLDWMGLERPNVLGVSFGGTLALELAARHPLRLDTLTVQGASAQFERSLLQQVAGLILSRYPLPSDSPFVNQFFNLLFGSKQRPGPLFQFVTRQCWQTDQSVMAHRFARVESFDMQAACMAASRAPTLILSGERDLLVSPTSLAKLAEGVADSKTVSLRGCGHLAFVTRPECVAAEVKQFVLGD